MAKDIINAINDYKKEIDDIGNIFYVFSTFRGRGGYDTEWNAEEIGNKYLCLRLDSAADRLYNRIIEDMPDNKTLKQRLDYVFLLLEMPDAWEHKDYFPTWDVEYWSVKNEKLMQVIGEKLTPQNDNTDSGKAIKENMEKNMMPIIASSYIYQLNRLAYYANTETTTLKRKLDLLRKKVENKKQTNIHQSSFIDRLFRIDKKGDMEIIHKILNGKRKKDFAVCICALVENGILSAQVTYTEIQNEFGDIGSKATINKYRNKNNLYTEDLESADKAIKKAFNLSQ